MSNGYYIIEKNDELEYHDFPNAKSENDSYNTSDADLWIIIFTFCFILILQIINIVVLTAVVIIKKLHILKKEGV